MVETATIKLCKAKGQVMAPISPGRSDITSDKIPTNLNASLHDLMRPQTLRAKKPESQWAG